MTVTRCAREYGITARPAGITIHPRMVTKLAPTLHRDIRRAVEGGLHGWQRLHRFQAVMTFPTIDTAADHLGIDQSTLVRQLQRLETDIGTTLYHRATTTQDMHPTHRGTTLLQALDHPDAQVSKKKPRPPVLTYDSSRRKRPLLGGSGDTQEPSAATDPTR